MRNELILKIGNVGNGSRSYGPTAAERDALMDMMFDGLVAETRAGRFELTRAGYAAKKALLATRALQEG